MLGVIILFIVILGYRGGFTGLTYPLTLVGLGLSAFSVISPWFAIAFAAFAVAHHARMQHPLFTPPLISMIGLVPIFGVLGLILTAVVMIKNLIVGVVCILLVGINFAIFKLRANREKKMLALFHSEIGKRYCDIVIETGKTVSSTMSMEEKTQLLIPIMEKRERIYRDIRAAGVNPKEFTRFVNSQVAMGSAFH